MLRQIDAIPGVTGLGRFELSTCREPVCGVLSHRLQQAIHKPAITLDWQDQRFVDDAGEMRKHLCWRQSIVCTYCFRSLQAPGPGEYCQAPEYDLLLWRQQSVAPVQRCSKCLLPGGCQSIRAREQLHAVAEPRCDFGRCEYTGLCRGEFYGQWNSVHERTYP